MCRHAHAIAERVPPCHVPRGTRMRAGRQRGGVGWGGSAAAVGGSAAGLEQGRHAAAHTRARDCAASNRSSDPELLRPLHAHKGLTTNIELYKQNSKNKSYFIKRPLRYRSNPGGVRGSAHRETGSAACIDALALRQLMVQQPDANAARCPARGPLRRQIGRGTRAPSHRGNN